MVALVTVVGEQTIRIRGVMVLVVLFGIEEILCDSECGIDG